ncbi:MAG TPA: matrixin family metalloprotease, partial [Kineosporiaceae bacterium]|nr:matrixin family metalloprotease [Kineosporiaceae bacterium]
SMDRADGVLTAGAGIRVRLTGVHVEPEPAPPNALAPHANRRLLLDDVLGHTEFYRRVSATAPPPGVTIGVPITVIVVRDIAGKVTGCSLGISADWVVVQASLFDRAQPNTCDDTVLVHELGHALNLPHHPDRDNIMFPTSSPPADVRGTSLRGWQAAVLHANRHVIPGVPD